MSQQLKTSREAFTILKELLPGGVNSPVRACSNLEVSPLVAEQGKGDLLFDVEENRYIDYCMSFGTLLLGHAPSSVVEAAIDQLRLGTTFGTSTVVEGELAALLIEAFPSAEKVRFVSSGTEATMTAIRLARAFTSRPIIVKFDGNYHGHADPFLVRAGSPAIELRGEPTSQGLVPSVIDYTISLTYNDEMEVKKLFQHPYYSKLIGAVIVEPVAGNMGVIPGDRNWIELLRQETSRIGALLIFDEVISGFRVRFGGVESEYGVTPDLTCLGKIIGGGMPVAAVCGAKKIMDQLSPLGKVFQAGTLSGNPLSMRMGLETLRKARFKGLYGDLVAKTQIITDPVRAEIKERKLDATVHQVGGMFSIFWGVNKVNDFSDVQKVNQRRFREFFTFLLERGIYLPPSPYEACFVSMAHTEDHLKETRDAILQFLTTC